MRYFIYLSYKGTNYHGWQVQPNGISVQEVLMSALSTVFRQEVEIVGAGRTDTGVHARLMVAHFDAPAPIVNLNDFVYKLNSLLPADIAIQKIVPVRAGAHARFDAISRRYEYWVTLSKNPFLTDAAMRLYGEIDFEAMNRAAKILFEYTDFTSFSKLHTDAKTNNCKILHAEWTKKDDNTWVFTIAADRFLRNMVRAVVGTLLQVGRGKLSENDFRKIIEDENRCSAGVSVPAHGLYLVEVEYPADLFCV